MRSLRVGLVAAAFVGAAACGRHAIRTSPTLAIPSAPAHEAPADGARRRTDAKLDALARRLRQSARPAEQPRPGEPQPAPMMGVVDAPGAVPQSTSGSTVVVTTIAPPKSGLANRDGEAASAPAVPASGSRPKRGVALAVMIAGVLIGAIKLVPRWTDRA